MGRRRAHWATIAALLLLLVVATAAYARLRRSARTRRETIQKALASALARLRPPVPDPSSTEVGAFYPCWRNPGAFREVVRRFRASYPNAPLVVYQDFDGAPEIRGIAREFGATAFVERPRRAGLRRVWTYASAEDFQSGFWDGLVRAASTGVRSVFVLEDDVWVLRPLPARPEGADAVVYRPRDELAPEFLGRPGYPNAGYGATMLSSSWILGVHPLVVRFAAHEARRVEHVRISGDAVVGMLLAAGGGRVVVDESLSIDVGGTPPRAEDVERRASVHAREDEAYFF